MKSKLASYKDLLAHKQQLKALLDAKKDLIGSDIELLKIETKPFSDLFGKISPSERKKQLLAIGAGLVARGAFKKLLMKTHWLVKLVLPYVDENSEFNLKKLIRRFTNRIHSILKKNPIEAATQGAAKVEKTG